MLHPDNWLAQMYEFPFKQQNVRLELSLLTQERGLKPTTGCMNLAATVSLLTQERGLKQPTHLREL